MIDTYEIADTVGRAQMADALGVGMTAVSKAVVAGRFPSSWFVTLKGLAESHNIECPPCLFGMKGLQDTSLQQDTSSGKAVA